MNYQGGQLNQFGSFNPVSQISGINPIPNQINQVKEDNNNSKVETFNDKNSQDLGKHYVTILNNIMKNQGNNPTNIQNNLNNFSQINSYLNSQINSQLNKFTNISNLYNHQGHPQQGQQLPNTAFTIQQKPETLIQNNNFNVNHNTINFTNQGVPNPNLQLLATLIANRNNMNNTNPTTNNTAQILNNANNQNVNPEKPGIDQAMIVQQLLSNMIKKNNIQNTQNIQQGQNFNTPNNFVQPPQAMAPNMNNIPNLINFLSSQMNMHNNNPQQFNPLLFQNKDLNALNLLKNNLKGSSNMHNLEDLANYSK